MTSTDPNVQTLDISNQQTTLSNEETSSLISELKRNVQKFKQSRLEAGRILTLLREGTAHGQWEDFLEYICQHVEISRASAHNYMKAYQDVRELPQGVQVACEEAKVNLDKKPVRDAIVKTAKENPHVAPAKVVALAQTPKRQDDSRTTQLRHWFNERFERFTLRPTEHDFRGQGGRMNRYDLVLFGLTPCQIKRVGAVLDL
jgi:hypothetical protein